MNETAQLARDYSREIGYTINEFLAAGLHSECAGSVPAQSEKLHDRRATG